MKIMVLSDTHIPFAANDLPAQIYQVLKEVDALIHTGDFVDMTLFRKLQQCARLEAVSGNMDCSEIKKILPRKKIVTFGKIKIGIVHGEGAKNNVRVFAKETFKHDGVQVIVFGHTHMPTAVTESGIIYFNPGSPTDKVFAPYNSFGLLHIDKDVETEIVKL